MRLNPDTVIKCHEIIEHLKGKIDEAIKNELIDYVQVYKEKIYIRA